MKSKVKRFVFLALLTACFLLFGEARATDVIFSLTDYQFGLSQTSQRLVIVQAESGTSVNGNNVLLPFKVQQTTGTNGICTFSNLFGGTLSGYYHVTIPAPPSRADFDIFVSNTNLGQIQASTIIGVLGASTYPAQNFAWSAQVSDARYQIGTNVSGAFVLPSQLLSASNALELHIKNASNDIWMAASNYSVLVTNGTYVAINSAKTNSTATNLTGFALNQVTNIAQNFTGSTNPTNDLSAAMIGRINAAGVSSTNFANSTTTGASNVVDIHVKNSTNIINAAAIARENVIGANGSNYTASVSQSVTNNGNIVFTNFSGNLQFGAISLTTNNAGYPRIGINDADLNGAGVLIGGNAGLLASNVLSPVFIGNDAARFAFNAHQSVFIGEGSGQSATNAADSIFVGEFSGQFAAWASNSIIIGHAAAYNAAYVDHSILIGENAGFNPSIKNWNIFIGNNSGTNSIGGTNNIDIGNIGSPETNVVRIGNPYHTDVYLYGLVHATNGVWATNFSGNAYGISNEPAAGIVGGFPNVFLTNVYIGGLPVVARTNFVTGVNYAGSGVANRTYFGTINFQTNWNGGSISNNGAVFVVRAPDNSILYTYPNLNTTNGTAVSGSLPVPEIHSGYVYNLNGIQFLGNIVEDSTNLQQSFAAKTSFQDVTNIVSGIAPTVSTNPTNDLQTAITGQIATVTNVVFDVIYNKVTGASNVLASRINFATNDLRRNFVNNNGGLGTNNFFLAPSISNAPYATIADLRLTGDANAGGHTFSNLASVVINSGPPNGIFSSGMAGFPIGYAAAGNQVGGGTFYSGIFQGSNNVLNGVSVASVIIGGTTNNLAADYSAIIGGTSGDIDGAKNSAVIAGNLNRMTATVGVSGYNIIAGGESNSITIDSAGFLRSAIIGGYGNQITDGHAGDSGRNSIILAGATNLIDDADNSVAAGLMAVVRSGHDNSFVFSDGSAGVFGTTDERQFLVNARKGIGFNTTNPIPGNVTVAGGIILSSNLTAGGSANLNSNVVLWANAFATISTNRLAIRGAGTDDANRTYFNGMYGAPVGTWTNIVTSNYMKVVAGNLTILNAVGVTEYQIAWSSLTATGPNTNFTLGAGGVFPVPSLGLGIEEDETGVLHAGDASGSTNLIARINLAQTNGWATNIIGTGLNIVTNVALGQAQLFASTNAYLSTVTNVAIQQAAIAVNFSVPSNSLVSYTNRIILAGSTNNSTLSVPVYGEGPQHIVIGTNAIGSGGGVGSDIMFPQNSGIFWESVNGKDGIYYNSQHDSGSFRGELTLSAYRIALAGAEALQIGAHDDTPAWNFFVADTLAKASYPRNWAPPLYFCCGIWTNGVESDITGGTFGGFGPAITARAAITNNAVFGELLFYSSPPVWDNLVTGARDPDVAGNLAFKMSTNGIYIPPNGSLALDSGAKLKLYGGITTLIALSTNKTDINATEQWDVQLDVNGDFKVTSIQDGTNPLYLYHSNSKLIELGFNCGIIDLYGTGINANSPFVAKAKATFNLGATTPGGKPVAVTVGASAFNFVNATGVNLECYFSGGTAYSITKNGASVYSSLAGNSYLILQPTNQIAITYTVAPTFFTNQF